MDEPQTFAELFKRLGLWACPAWEKYLEQHESISDALLSLPVDTKENMVSPFTARSWLYAHVDGWVSPRDKTRGSKVYWAYARVAAGIRGDIEWPHEAAEILRFTKKECDSLVKHARELLKQAEVKERWQRRYAGVPEA